MELILACVILAEVVLSMFFAHRIARVSGREGW